MDKYWIVIIPVGIAVSLFIKWIMDSSKDFTDIIKPELESKGMKFVRLTYPGLFKVGPFKKFEITIGKPLINGGTIQYENTYYRKVELETRKKSTKVIWAKIETSWFKETKIEFKPKLSEIKNK